MKNLFFILILLSIYSCNRKEISKIDRKTYDKAYDFFDASKDDSAFVYFNKAKDELIMKNYSSYAGNSLVIMGIIQNEKGDYYGAQETALSALQYLDTNKDSAELAANYNNLGVAFQNLKNYYKAANYYEQAAKFSQNTTDSLTHINNKAVALSYLRKFDLAILLFNEILSFPNIEKESILYSKVYDNKAFTKFLQNENYNAENELLNAVKIRKDIKDSLGLNASFSHLSDYFEKKDPKKSLFYANEMLKVASAIQSPDDKLSALKKIILLEKPTNIKEYFKIHQKLDDSLQIARNKSKSQFAVERFDSEKFKRESLEKDNSILKLFTGIIILILIAIFIIIKLRQQKELEVKNTQLKMSKRVHDVVANGIYQVMAKIENQEDFDRDKALDELEFVYEKSRDLSYEKAGEEKEFSQEISELIAGFNNATMKTFTAGNDPSVWEKVSPAVKEEVYQMVRELMVNMKKHSQASHVAVKFEKTGETVEIQYKDNGVGISGDLIYKNGLRNTASRIEAIGGTITFDTKIEKGLKVNLSFPAS